MKTIKISLPFGRTFFQSLLFTLVVCAALEFLSRMPVVDRLFLPESYGTSHPHFETQMKQLKARVAREGAVDCIFIGNSQVLYGIDPVTVEQTYLNETGRAIHCQNFGLGGLPPMSAAPLAQVLIKNFHPAIIVFGTGLWDYSSANADSTHASLMSSPWFKYQFDDFTLDGWFYENSNAFRYIFGVDRALKSPDDKSDRIDVNGHAAYSGQTQLTLNEQLEYFETIAKRPELTQRQMDGLHDLLALNSGQVKIIVIETPFDPAFLEARRKARLLYPDFKNMLAAQTSLAGVDLWPTQDSIDFPQDEWYDLIHLNEEGATHFSRLLGSYLAAILPASPQ